MIKKSYKNSSLEKTKEEFYNSLLRLNYSDKTLYNYKWTFNSLEKYMNENDEKEYLPTIGKAFLENEHKIRNYNHKSFVTKEMVIRRFNEFLDGIYTYRESTSNYECPIQFSGIFNEYINNLKQELRELTVKKHKYNCLKALIKFDLLGIHSIDSVEAADI